LDESLPPARQRVKVLAKTMRLRRACCNPKLVLPDTPIESSNENRTRKARIGVGDN